MYWRLPSILILAALASVPGATLPAQGSDAVVPLDPGQRMRVTYRRLLPPAFGEFVSADSQMLVLREQRSNYILTVPWEHVGRLDAGIGQRSASRSIGRGLALGFLTGVGLGTIAFVAVKAISSDESCRCDRAAPVKALAIAGTPVTTAVGGILGAVGGKDIWRRVPVPETPPRLTIRPLSDGAVGLAFGVGW